MLQQLEEAGLFVMRDDDVGDWYRYHDLLRTALGQRLRQRYDAVEIRTLHRQASTWFALPMQNGCERRKPSRMWDISPSAVVACVGA